MSEHNFDSFKNLEIPQKWVDGALDVPQQNNSVTPLFYRAVAVALSLTLIVTVSCAVFFFGNAAKITKTATNPPKDSVIKETLTTDLSPAGIDTFFEQITPSDSSATQPTATDNICVGTFSDDLVVGEKNIYCAIYDYKTGAMLGDDNIFSSERIAQIEYNDDGMVSASYDPVEAGIVKKTGEYWYVFYNELVLSPVQGYIFIYI